MKIYFDLNQIFYLSANEQKSVIELFFDKKVNFVFGQLVVFVRKTIILLIIGQRDKRIKRCKGLGLYLSWKDNEETIVDFPLEIKSETNVSF